jgi:hypothetical protein
MEIRTTGGSGAIIAIRLPLSAEALFPFGGCLEIVHGSPAVKSAIDLMRFLCP